MHLTNACRCERMLVPFCEELFGRRSQFFRDYFADSLRAHRWPAVLEPCQHVSQLRCESQVHEAEHLAELRHEPLHLAHRLEQSPRVARHPGHITVLQLASTAAE